MSWNVDVDRIAVSGFSAGGASGMLSGRVLG